MTQKLMLIGLVQPLKKLFHFSKKTFSSYFPFRAMVRKENMNLSKSKLQIKLGVMKFDFHLHSHLPNLLHPPVNYLQIGLQAESSSIIILLFFVQCYWHYFKSQKFGQSIPDPKVILNNSSKRKRKKNNNTLSKLITSAKTSFLNIIHHKERKVHWTRDSKSGFNANQLHELN